MEGRYCCYQGDEYPIKETVKQYDQMVVSYPQESQPL